MSVGLLVRLEDLPKGFFKRRRDPARLLREFANACPQVAASVDPLLGQLVAFEEFQSGIELELLPGLEPLHLELTEGAAEISASTSGGGPGYHVYVVELIEAAAAAIGAVVHLDDPADEGARFQDEGGYFHTRDFQGLEQEVSGWLHGIGKVLAEGNHWEEIALMWAIDRPRALFPGIVTPMGPQTRELFVQAAESVQAAPALGRALLPWWERGFTARTAANLALLLGWSELRWRVPKEERERQRMQQFVAAVERARQLDPTLPLPEKELAEARTFLEAEDEGSAPAKEGIGYFRGLVRATAPGGWTCDVPGFWYDGWEDDGETANWGFDGLNVRLSSFSADSELPVPSVPERTPEQRAFFPVEQERLKGWAEVKEEEGALQLVGKLVSANHQCLLTVSCSGPDGLERAEQVFRSIRPPPPPEAAQ